MGKFKYLLAGLAGSFAFAGAASAAVITPTIDGAAGSFQNPTVQCSPTTSCPGGQGFTDTVSFVTPTGFNSVSAILNSTFNTSNPLTNLNFGSVIFNNGVSNFTFNITNGNFDDARRELIPLIAGATNTLTINGTTFGDASYSGTLSFGNVAAVPEPGTWGLMLLGFGAVGFSMRRRGNRNVLLQAA